MPPPARRRRSRRPTCCGGCWRQFCLILIIVIILSTAQAQFATPPEAQDCPSHAKIVEISHTISVVHEQTPQYSALRWLLVAHPCDNDAALTPDFSLTITQQYILTVLYYSTNGQNWSNCSSQSSSTCPPDQYRYLDTSVSECDWFGNTCNAAHELIVIKLADNHLVGSLPWIELSHLTQLVQLDLDSNELIGELWSNLENNKFQFKVLKILDLSNNDLAGSIPTVFYNSTSLELIDLSYNNLMGPLTEAINNLTNLRSLKLNSNQLSGTPPLSLINLHSLNTLYLQDNHFHGLVPSGALCDLVELLADCPGEVECECCTECFVPLTVPPTASPSTAESSLVPTISPTLSDKRTCQNALEVDTKLLTVDFEYSVLLGAVADEFTESMLHTLERSYVQVLADQILKCTELSAVTLNKVRKRNLQTTSYLNNQFEILSIEAAPSDVVLSSTEHVANIKGVLTVLTTEQSVENEVLFQILTALRESVNDGSLLEMYLDNISAKSEKLKTITYLGPDPNSFSSGSESVGLDTQSASSISIGLVAGISVGACAFFVLGFVFYNHYYADEETKLREEIQIQKDKVIVKSSDYSSHRQKNRLHNTSSDDQIESNQIQFPRWFSQSLHAPSSDISSDNGDDYSESRLDNDEACTNLMVEVQRTSSYE